MDIGWLAPNAYPVRRLSNWKYTHTRMQQQQQQQQ